MKAFLGINEAGAVRLFISPFALNELGPRNERGTKFPDSVYAFQGHSEGEPIPALKDAQKYFDKIDEKRKRK